MKQDLLVFLYEKEVQDKAVETGLITHEKIKRNKLLFMLLGMLPCWIFMIYAVYFINGARGFWEGFWQMYVIMMIEGLFDRLFIDFYWVGKTKAWLIPKTEEFMPYIYGKTLVFKWLGTLIDACFQVAWYADRFACIGSGIVGNHDVVGEKLTNRA